MCSWPIPMPSAASVWTMISAPVPFGQAVDSPDGNELALVRSELERVLRPRGPPRPAGHLRRPGPWTTGMTLAGA